MRVRIRANIVPFGTVRLETGERVSPAEDAVVEAGREPVRYEEPIETASGRYDILYEGSFLRFGIPQETA